MKKKVATGKRRVRCAAPVRRERVVAEYLQAKTEYESKVRDAQTESWKDLCMKQDREGLYRVLVKTAKRQEDVALEREGLQLSPAESAAFLAETFYPEDSELGDNPDHRATRELAMRINERVHDEIHDPPFTALELGTALSGFHPKKAPGADGFTADICRQAILQDPEAFLALANKCLSMGHFPKQWKEATVIVLRKPGKDNYRSAKSYRPIGLLPVLGKILEKMTVTRLQWYLVPRLSTRQYGFMPQKGTEDALYALMNEIRAQIKQKKLVTLISLDIEGAFDSAWWPAIKVRLAEERCPVNIRRLLDSYLDGRCVNLRYAGEQHERATQKGCVQGSIGGPILWNVLLDPLLGVLQREGVWCQAFADDVVLVFAEYTALEVQRRANAALECVRMWGVRNKLKFAPHKTCAMLVTNKLKYDTPLLSMGGVDIGMSPEIKILGLTIDRKLTFNSHIKNVCRKALNIYKQLARAAKISWGLHPDIVRVIYTAAVEPVVTYAAAAWAPSSKKLGARTHLNSVQRGFAQKICRSYRTVSLHSALVLAGILPLDLRIQEAAALYEARKGSSRLVLGDREVERVVSFAESPHPALRMDIRFQCLDDQELVDSENVQERRIFTDGSKIEGKVGAALSIWDSGAEIKYRKLCLPAYCTVYQAELLAICRALVEILKCNKQSFGVYSDSRAALQSVANYSVFHPLAVQARRSLSEALAQGKVVTLFWIKAHAGFEGNERADCLAKEAALSCRKRPDYDLCPVSFVKRELRGDSLDEWNRRYREGETASVTRVFLPDARDAHSIVRRLRPQGVLTQILTGHGGFSQYLNRFKCRESPSCVCDPASQESATHILFECPEFSVQRFDLQQLIETEVSVANAHCIFADRVARMHFIKFALNICSKVIERNK